MENQLAVDMHGISKLFPGQQALKDVDFDVRRAEVHALVGENGAGKSTLMKILAGSIPADSGTIHIGGREVTFRRPIDAIRAGISTIYQELMLCPNLSVSANVFLGHELTATPGAFIKEDVLRERSRENLQLVGMDVDPRTIVGRLTIAQQQMVEIAKALSLESQVIIMDEPTSALTQRETDHLYTVLRLLRDQGRSVIYISHRLEEIFTIANRATVLRDGELVGTVNVSESSPNELVRMMVGRELELEGLNRDSSAAQHGGSRPLLEARSLTRRGVFQDISFTVYPGEVVGFAGLVGAGRTEVMRAVFGIDSLDSGTVLRSDKEIKIRSPKDAIKNGLGMTTEDRKYDGLFPNFTVRENASVADLDDLSVLGFVKAPQERREVSKIVKELDVRPPNPNRMMVNLSGGNQQKVTIARWLMTDPEVLIVDEPTRGVDVGAKVEIRRLIRELAQRGKGIVMVSSELPELLGTADRILVMSAGRLVAELDARKTSQEEIMSYAATGAGVSTGTPSPETQELAR
jgi:ABC-type sugar transport system ATPase subunit